MLLSMAESIKLATDQIMDQDETVVVIGEGVPDPKAVFGTTKNLKHSDRVFDMPISENGGTGICIGAAITGMKPILVHQRIDFSLYAMDQLVNNAAKWYSMYGGNAGNCPLVIRMVVGRGWGQGNQHSQNLSGLYATIPGLKVVVPSNARSAHGLLFASVLDPNPVLFIEHRWLHHTTSDFNEVQNPHELGKAETLTHGNDVTIVAWGYMVTEALAAAKALKEEGMDAEVIDLKTIRPIDWNTIDDSVYRTNKLVILDDTWAFNSLAGEIAFQFRYKAETIERVCLPDCYAPSSPHMANEYYPKTSTIVDHIMLNCFHKLKVEAVRKLRNKELDRRLDVPNKEFKGPF